MCSIIGTERKKSNKSWWQCAAASSKGANRHDKVPLNGALKANRMWHFDYRREKKTAVQCTLVHDAIITRCSPRLLVPSLFVVVAESSVSAHIFFGFECMFFRRLFYLLWTDAISSLMCARAYAITWWFPIDFNSAYTFVCVFISFILIHFFDVIVIFDCSLEHLFLSLIGSSSCHLNACVIYIDSILIIFFASSCSWNIAFDWHFFFLIFHVYSFHFWQSAQPRSQ